MFALSTWGRFLLGALLLLLISHYTFAERSAATLRSTGITTSETSQSREPAGSPELGVLIIAGIVGFLILVAWIFSRIGEGGSRHADTLN
jgi:hypothetical protein